MNRKLIVGVFFLSGAVGLVYEIVWVRELTLLLGVSIYAVSAVLTAFMGGLGIGAEYFGRKLDRGAAPVRLYSLLEIGVGVYVLLFPLIMEIIGKGYVLFHPGGGGSAIFVTTLRFLMAVLALIVPTSLMGGTLPALGRFLSVEKRDIGGSFGLLYAVNTIGAVAGCVFAGFWLIEHAGLANTLKAGAVVNIICGVAAYLLAGEKGWTVAPKPSAPETETREGTSPLYPFLLGLFALSGFCAMSLEVLWTRMLILLLNNTIYAFSLILAIFLLGIGAGSAVTSRMARKTPDEVAALFARFQIGIGLFALISLAGFAFNGYLTNYGGSFAGNNAMGGAMTEAVIFSALTVFPCTFLMGGSFPLVAGAVSGTPEKTGGAVGRLYAVNIAGCVLGSMAAGYLFIPLLGVRAGIMAVSWLAVIGGIYLQMKASKKRKMAQVAIPVAALAAATFVVLFIGDTSFLLSAQKLDSGSKVDYYEEGPSATVLVSSQDSDLTVGRQPIKRIWINGDPIAGAFREALQLERLQAHIPLMIHPAPKKALVICFGTGTTAGTALQHGLESVTAVDISREVFGAADNFSKANFNVVHSPAFRKVEEDGRNFLLTTRDQFDFITSEPPPPSNAGIVNLYTKEYYQLCRKRLAQGGIVSQWIPLHHLSRDDFRALVATFTDVFPNAAMWYTKWDAIMVGSNADMPLVFSRFESEMKKAPIADSLKEIGITNAHQLLSNFMMGPEQLRQYTSGFLPVTDDRPYVEFTAPRIHSQGVAIKGRNLEDLLKFRAAPEVKFDSPAQEAEFKDYFRSEEEFLRGQVESSDGRHADAARRFLKALEITPKNNDARYAYLTLNITTLYSSLSKAQPDLGIKMLDDTEKMDVDSLFAIQTFFLRGMFYAKKGEYYSAEREFLSALGLDSRYIMGVVNLAGLYGFMLKNEARAKDLYNYALTLEPSESERKSIVEALGKLN